MFKQYVAGALLGLSVVSMISTGCTKPRELSKTEQQKLADAEAKAKAAQDKMASLDQRDQDLKTKEDEAAKASAKLAADIASQADAAKQLDQAQAELAKAREELNAEKTALEQESQSVNLTKDETQKLKEELAQRQSQLDKKDQQLSAQAQALIERSNELQKNIEASKDLIKTNDDMMDQMLQKLTAGEAYPLLVVITGEEGGVSLARVKEQLLKVDTSHLKNPRFNEFEGNGRATGVYLITADSSAKFKDFVKFTRKNSKFAVLVQPVNRVKVRSFVRISYSQASIGSTQDKRFVIGETSPAEVGLNYPNTSLENVSSYTMFPKECASVTPACVSALLAKGYMQNTVVTDKGERMKAVDYFKGLVADSAQQRDHGNMGGGVFRKAQVITNITLEHEVWIEGPTTKKSDKEEGSPLLSSNPEILGGTLLEKSANNYYYRSPVTPFKSEVPQKTRARNTTLTAELFDILDVLP